MNLLPAHHGSMRPRVVVEDRAGSDRRFGAFVLGAWLLVVVLATYVVHGALPHNALVLPAEDRIAIRRLMPQGWSFFTRSPREIDLAAYRLRGKEWVPWDSVWRMHDMGFDRGSRAPGIEIGLILAEIPQATWAPCDGPVGECLRKTAPIPVANQSSGTPRLCGTLGIVREEPTPWAWRTSQLSIPLEALRLEVSC